MDITHAFKFPSINSFRIFNYLTEGADSMLNAHVSHDDNKLYSTVCHLRCSFHPRAFHLSGPALMKQVGAPLGLRAACLTTVAEGHVTLAAGEATNARPKKC